MDILAFVVVPFLLIMVSCVALGYVLGYMGRESRPVAAVPAGKPDATPEPFHDRAADRPQFPGLSAEQVALIRKVHADFRNDRAREILAEARRRTEEGTLTQAEHDEIVNVLLDNGYLNPKNP